MSYLQSDWAVIWTAEETKREIGLDLHGPGWYETQTDTVLAIMLPPDTKTKKELGPRSKIKFHIYVWNCVGVREVLGSILGMRVFSDFNTKRKAPARKPPKKLKRW